MPFEAVRDALATVTGMSAELAGFTLGLIVIIVIVVALAWALGDMVGPAGMFIGGGIAIAFSVLVGWWPVWTVLFIGLILAFLLIGPFKEGGVIG